jgi:disease resistance protein RPS2
MIEPGLVFGILGQLQPLLNRVIDAVEITLKYDKSCRKLSDLLLSLQPLLQHTGNRAPNLSSNVNLVHAWLTELEKRLKAAETTLNVSNEQHPRWTAPVSRYRAASEIKKLTESVEELLQKAPVVGLDAALSISVKVENATKDTQHALQSVENQLSILTRQLPNVTRQLADVTRQCFKPSIVKSLNIEEATVAIITALQNLKASDDHDNRMEALPLTLATIDPQQPSPKLHVPQFVFGLDDSIGRLQQLLLSRHSDADPHSVGVWGKGGVGKTLLARKVHNSMEVQQHFGNANIIWLTVGKDPDIMSLYRTLSERLRPNLVQSNTLHDTDYKDILYNEFSSRRALFIVDDVWEESVIEWLDLAKAPGSVTLWTSRKEGVLLKARVKEATTLHMDKLSKEDSWRLFCVHAFGQRNIPPGVEGFAHSIVDECQGLPLALKVIGGVMIGKTLPGEWERQLYRLQQSRETHQDVEKQLFNCLKTSYDDLENANHPNAKECFLYFAAFREDELLEQTRLFQYWVAEGLVPGEVGDDPEQDTYYVLGLLIGRSLIELECHTENKLCCKIHRVLRDLAFHIIRSHDADEKKQLALYRPGRHLQVFPIEWRTNGNELLAVRRLSLNDNNLKTLPTKISAPHMWTLLLSHNEQLEVLPNGFLKGIRQNLKVLDLSFNK